jgi:hypothetical protein
VACEVDAVSACRWRPRSSAPAPTGRPGPLPTRRPGCSRTDERARARAAAVESQGVRAGGHKACDGERAREGESTNARCSSSRCTRTRATASLPPSEISSGLKLEFCTVEVARPLLRLIPCLASGGLPSPLRRWVASPPGPRTPLVMQRDLDCSAQSRGFCRSAFLQCRARSNTTASWA